MAKKKIHYLLVQVPDDVSEEDANAAIFNMGFDVLDEMSITERRYEDNGDPWIGYYPEG
jgi:hypothetical protein